MYRPNDAQIVFPYSSNGLTSETYSGRIVCFSLNVYELLIILRILLALFAIYWTWALNVKQLSTFTPKSFSKLVSNNGFILLTCHHLDGNRNQYSFYQGASLCISLH